MTPEGAAALRKPFDAKQVGKLPKGGTNLDYVGHAAVTDRLLSIDPAWTWEPLAFDEWGNPQPDAAGNLWIRLTVLGVTRIGVGDGNSMKIRIGDAIRNAAMRFGVALDLWSKEELEQAAGPTIRPAPPIDPTTLETADNPTTEAVNRAVERVANHARTIASQSPITAAQVTKLQILMTEVGITERADRLDYVRSVIDRPVSSSKELNKAEAHAVIEALTKIAEPEGMNP